MSDTPVTEAKAQNNPLADIPAAALAAELARRQRRVQTLQRRHLRVAAEADKLRAEIEALGGSTSVAPGNRQPYPAQPRSRNATSLIEALKNVLSAEALSVSETMKKVMEAGYQSNSPSFRQIVNQTLAKCDQFERVGRGMYKAK